MEVSVATLLVSLWLKTLLNWVVLLVQKGHIGQRFWGVFCISLALGDALLHLSITCVFLLQEVQVFGLYLTKYHVCVLIQMACLVQGFLQWPVFVLLALDVLWSGGGAVRYAMWSLPTSCPGLMKTVLHATAVLLLWTLAASYVFSVPDFHTLTGDEDDHATLQLCQVTGGSQSRQVAWASLLMLVGVACYEFCVRGKFSEQLKECVCHFLSTWSSFLLLLLFILGSGAEVPPYLELNTVWLCFLHSLHTVVAMRSCACVFCSRAQDDKWENCTNHTHVYKTGFTDRTPSALYTRRIFLTPDNTQDNSYSQ